MQTEKAPLTLPAINGQTSASATAWFEILHLKQVFRKGWLERGLPPARCESVAEHSYGNAMLCLLLAQQQPDLNVEKILRMALIHDLGEVYVGDLTPTDAVDPKKKYAMEKQAVLKILSGLPAGDTLLEKLGRVRGPSHARSSVCQASRSFRVCAAGGAIRAGRFDHRDGPTSESGQPTGRCARPLRPSRIYFLAKICPNRPSHSTRRAIGNSKF